jgi:hypothetical protein
MRTTFFLILALCVLLVVQSSPTFEKAWEAKYLAGQAGIRCLGEEPTMNFHLACYNEESSNELLGIFYDLYHEVASHPAKQAGDITEKYLSNVGDRVAKIGAAWACERDSDEIRRLVNLKIGMALWSDEMVGDIIRYAQARPEEFWIFSYNINRVFNKRDFEATGTLFGLQLYVIGQWKKDTLRKSTEL